MKIHMEILMFKYNTRSKRNNRVVYFKKKIFAVCLFVKIETVLNHSEALVMVLS